MDKEPSASGRLLIGDLILDRGRRQVRRGSQVLELPRLSYQLVLTLAQAAPNTVTQDELVSRVWPGKVVSPETITQRVKLVRQALGDNANSPDYVGLVRGEGYRMLAPVRSLPGEDDSIARHLFSELGRRRVLQTAIIYAAAAWSITEFLSFLINALPVFPAGFKTFVAILLVAGFPMAVFLAWRFDFGHRGIKRPHAASTEGRLPITAATLLLIGATAGLFYLIYPQVRDSAQNVSDISSRSVPEVNTIAVMPFVNASQFSDDQYIIAGLGDELRSQLGRIAGMRVAAGTSSDIFEDVAVDAREIAARLGVAKLIEGTVRRQDDVLHITVTIVDGATGFQDWTKNFQKNADNLLALQQEIATEIVARMMPNADPMLAAATSATLNASANELLQLARYEFDKVKSQPSVDMPLMIKVIELYSQATEEDPESALAHSRLADALLYIGDVESAQAAITRALEINPNLSEVQYTLGLYRWLRFEDGAGDAHLRAIELNPNNADALGAYGKWLWHQQITNASESYFLRALQLDRESLSRYIDLGNFYGISGQRDKALEIAGEVQAKFQSAASYLVLARIYELVGNLDVGIAWAMRSQALDPEYADALWMLGELHARIGDATGAQLYDPDGFNVFYWLRRYDEMLDVGEDLSIEHPNQVQIWYGLARGYVATGNYENAIRILERQDIPQHAYVDSRRANGIEALMTYADALNEVGRVDEARDIARWVVAYMRRLSLTGSEKAWWPNLYEACARSVLGEDELALDTLQRVTESPGLLWYPVLVDSRCFRKYSDNLKYQSIVQSVEQRQKILRDRLPATLQRFQIIP